MFPDRSSALHLAVRSNDRLRIDEVLRRNRFRYGNGLRHRLDGDRCYPIEYAVFDPSLFELLHPYNDLLEMLERRAPSPENARLARRIRQRITEELNEDIEFNGGYKRYLQQIYKIPRL